MVRPSGGAKPGLAPCIFVERGEQQNASRESCTITWMRFPIQSQIFRSEEFGEGCALAPSLSLLTSPLHGHTPRVFCCSYTLAHFFLFLFVTPKDSCAGTEYTHKKTVQPSEKEAFLSVYIYPMILGTYASARSAHRLPPSFTFFYCWHGGNSRCTRTLGTFG